jgi:uncharacterized protein (TIGR00369 family)
MSGFVPRDPDWESRVAAGFARQAVMRTLGIRIERLAPGEVDLGFDMDDRLGQQHGYVHAGVVTTALDSACGYAAWSLMVPPAEVLTVEFKTNLLAPARGARFVCRGRVIRPGRTLTVCEGSAHAVTGDGEVLVAMMTATMMAVSAR